VRQPHVLLIEGDVAIRAATHLLLRVAGYHVSVAACTAEAVEHARRHADIEVVICDDHLGYTECGTEAIAAVRAICAPGLRAVLMCGDAGPLRADTERDSRTSVSQMPARAEELLALLPSPQS